MSRRSGAIAAALALVGAAGLSGCVTPTPYQPVVKGSATSGGFSETRIEPDRWRVTFAGNTATKRETVETYLLYRAAELTVQNGYDWFSVDGRQTDKRQRFYATDPFYGPWYGGFGYWRPAWRYRGYGGWGGWGGWGPYGGYGFGYGGDIQTIQDFEASAEIMTHKGAKPAGDPRAFDARAVVENLKPKIVYPQPAR